MPRPYAPTERPSRGQRRGDVRVGTIAGVPVHVDWTVLVLVWLLGTTLITRVLPDADPGLSPLPRLLIGVAGAAAFVGSILAHELGHAVVARRGGVPVDSISLWLFGGVARMATEASRPALALRIAAAGPATSLAIGAAGLGAEAALHALGLAPGIAAVAAWLGGINLLLALFNLLPGLPLDGGRILEAALWWRSGDRQRASGVAAGAGRVIGYGLIALGGVMFLRGNTFGGLWLGLIGAFLANAARTEASGRQVRAALDGLTVQQVMSPGVPSVPSYLTVAELLRDHVPQQRRDTFLVLDWGGALEGLAWAPRLARLAPGRAAEAHLREVAVPIAEVPWARPDEALLDVLQRSGDGPVVVVADQQVVGVVGPAEVERAVRWRSAAHPSGR